MHKILSISVRSYNEVNECINLFISIQRSIESFRAKTNFSYIFPIYWFENDPKSYHYLSSWLKHNKNLARIADITLYLGDNSRFSYWESAEAAILHGDSEYRLILSGHCLIGEDFIYQLYNILLGHGNLIDCYVLPISTNPLKGSSVNEAFFTNLVYSSLLIRVVNLFRIRAFASIMLSNSNALYHRNALLTSPMPHLNGGEDTAWLSMSKASFYVLPKALSVLHSHNSNHLAEEQRRKLIETELAIYQPIPSNFKRISIRVKQIFYKILLPFLSPVVTFYNPEK